VVVGSDPDPDVSPGRRVAGRGEGDPGHAGGFPLDAPDSRCRRPAGALPGGRRANHSGKTVELSVVCPEEADTMAVAGRIAAEVRPGGVIVLSGDLGAGKDPKSV